MNYDLIAEVFYQCLDSHSALELYILELKNRNQWSEADNQHIRIIADRFFDCWESINAAEKFRSVNEHNN